MGMNHEIDPVFSQVVSLLYGDAVDPREVWISKMSPDQSAVSTPGQQKARQKKLGGALALGTAAETAATAAAGKNLYNKLKKPVIPKVPEGIEEGIKQSGKFASKLKAFHGSKAGATAEFGLQAANLAVGGLAAKELLKDPDKPKKIKKNAVGVRNVNAIANQTGVVTPPKKKATLRRVDQSPVTFNKALGLTTASRARKAAAAAAHHERLMASNQKAVRRGRRLVAASAFAGGAAGGYTGIKRYHMRLVNPIQPQSAMVVKKNQEVEYTWEGDISKVDADKRLVFGWCSLSKVNGDPVVDLQGDYIPIEETETSAYRYVIESRKGGDMHRRVSKFNQDEPLHTADLVESMVFTPEKLQKMGLAPDALPHGWWIGMKVNDDDQWAAVKNGQRLGFSIHGKGRRVEKAL